MKRVLIIGATGQLGSFLFNYLRQDDSIELLGTSRNKVDGLLQFDPFVDNWEVFGSIDVLINCVGQIVEQEGMTFEKIHVQLSALLLKNRTILNNPRLIQLSVLGASPLSSIDFLSSKGKADALLLSHRNTYVLRPSIVCTHNTMLSRKLKLLHRFSRFMFGCIFVPIGFLERKIQPLLPEDLAELVLQLCKRDDIEHRTINVVGPEKYSYKQLLQGMFLTKKTKYRIVEIPKPIVDFFLNRIPFPFLKHIVNKDQYRLLFSDNISDDLTAKEILGRSLGSTKDFWENEFKENASNKITYEY